MADLSNLPFIDLRHMREAGDTRDEVVAAEHRAFTRGVAAENPALGLAIAGMILPYQALKASFGGTGKHVASYLTGGKPGDPPPSDASLRQAIEAYKGVYEGIYANVRQRIK